MTHTGNGNGRKATIAPCVSISIGSVPEHIRQMFDAAVTDSQHGWIGHARATDALLQAHIMPKMAAYIAANALGRTHGSTARTRHALWDFVGEDMLTEFHFFSETDWRLLRSIGAQEDKPLVDVVDEVLATSEDYGGLVTPTEVIAMRARGKPAPADKFAAGLERSARGLLAALRACPQERVEAVQMLLTAVTDEYDAWQARALAQAEAPA